MGWFDMLQQKGVPFESVQARSINKVLFRKFRQWSDTASRELAYERGLPPDALKAAGWWARLVTPLLVALGLTKLTSGRYLFDTLVPETMRFRNVNRQALAPTATIGIIAGASPSIEPPAGNVFVQKTLSGSFVVRNPQLERVLTERYPGRATNTTWLDILVNDGSVQQFDWMSDEDKKLFRTAYELNQRELVQQAADRQPSISQAQSLNLFFVPGTSGKISAAYLNEVHMMAWKLGVKSCYYVRSEPAIKAAQVDGVKTGAKSSTAALVDSLEREACSVCQ